MFNLHSFRFEGTKLFLGRGQDAFAACSFYFLAIALGNHLMRDRKAFDLRWLFICHNLFLSAASLLLLSSFLFVLLDKSFHFNAWQMICSPVFHEDGRLQLLYYLNYLVKWYELLDTGFLVLKKKPILFLHSYHHAATLLLCWIQMDQHSAVQWVPIVINLMVHVVMYYYYFLTACGGQVWWKAYLTQLQILQFLIDLVACGYASTHEPVASVVGLGWARRPACHGTVLGAGAGLGILSSYLVLFLLFYIATYTRGGKSGSAGRSAGHLPPKDRHAVAEKSHGE